MKKTIKNIGLDVHKNSFSMESPMTVVMVKSDIMVKLITT